MVVDTGSTFWKLENGVWRVDTTFNARNGWKMEVERKKNSQGQIIQYSSYDWWHQGKKPGGAQWNPGGGDGFKGNKAKAWTKGVVGMLTGNEKIMDAAFHGSTDDFLKSTGEGMSDAELAINLSVIGAGVVGGIASSRAGVRSGHTEAGNLKALRAKYKITKQQVKQQAIQDKVDISKVSEANIDSFVREWNARDPVDNVKIADSYMEKAYKKANDDQATHLKNKPVWRGGSWDRAKPSEKSSFTTRWNSWKATKGRLEAAVERIGNKFSRIRQQYNRLKAERDRIAKERGKKAAEDAVKKFETANDLKPLTFMEYLLNFKKIYTKNPTEAELTEFKPKFNNYRVDLKNVDSEIKRVADENYKAAGQDDATATYFRMWEDIKSKNNGKINLKTFEEQIASESAEAMRSARASRVKQFEDQHGLKHMTIEEYIYKYQENNNGYRPNRAQLKKFIADYNDYRIDLNNISESTKAKIMEDYEAAGEKTPNLYEVWEINKIKGGNFEEALLKDAAQSRRAAAYTEKISKLEGLDKDGDGQLTKEEVKEFNKKFDFDADGILGKEEKAAKAAEVEEKYGDLDAEERRLLEDDEIEVDLTGEGERTTPPKKGSGKATKAGAGAAAGGTIAGAVAAAVSDRSKSDNNIDEEKILPDNLPEPRRRIVEFNIYDELLKFFGNEYFYPNRKEKDAYGMFFKSGQYYQNTKSPFIQDIPPNNPFDVGGNQVPVNINTQPYHPDITKKKAHELLLKSLHSYDNKVDHNSVLIENTEGTLDVQVKIFTEAMYKVVAFRGTETTAGFPSSLGDILTDGNTFSARLSSYFPFIQAKDDLIAHQGFLRSLAFVYDDIKIQLEGVENFEITGHSMGAALGSIFAYVYAIDTNKYPVHAFVFGSPRVFIGDVEKYNKRIDLVRFQNSNDGATFIPTQEFSAQSAGSALVGAAGGITLAKQYSQPNTGMLTTAGALLAMGAMKYTNPLPFKHVGLGIMLFRDKNEVVNLRDSKENPGMRVVQENYLFVPEGEDIARNPINIEGLIVKSVWDAFSGTYLTQAVLGSGGFEDPVFNTLFKQYKEDSRFGNSFLKSAYGFYQAFIDSNVILVSNKYTNTLLRRVQKYRRSYLQYQSQRDPLLELESDFSPIKLGVLTAENLKKMGQDILKVNKNFLDLPEVDRMDYFYEATSILDLIPGSTSLQKELYGEYMKDIKKLINKYFKEQKTSDFFYLRDCFARYHIYTTIVATKIATQAIEAYTHFDGHLISTYLERIDEIPDIIYSGQNIPQVIHDQMEGGGEGGGGFETYTKNHHLPNTRHYYDSKGNGVYVNNFNRIKKTDEILGFIFYKDESVLNKLILY